MAQDFLLGMSAYWIARLCTVLHCRLVVKFDYSKLYLWFYFVQLLDFTRYIQQMAFLLMIYLQMINMMISLWRWKHLFMRTLFFFALKLNHVYAVTYCSIHSIYEELMEFYGCVLESKKEQERIPHNFLDIIRSNPTNFPKLNLFTYRFLRPRPSLGEKSI